MAGRLVDLILSVLTTKSTSIDGTEKSVIANSTGTLQSATLANQIRYGGGSPRNTTAGNATVTQTTDGSMYLEVSGQTAGNARGVGAFDWNAVRSAATAVASGANAVSFAINGVAANVSQFIFGRGPGAGTAQGNLQTFYTVTTDATSTPLNITGTATDRMVIPATRACTFIGVVTAMDNISSSSNFIKAWKIEGCITRDGSNTTRIVGTPTITVIAQDSDGTPTPSTWAISSITADDTNEALAINVTGQSGQTIRWQATVLYSQVGF